MTFLKYRQNEKQSEEFSSIEWLTTQAVANHKEGKLEEAIAFYLEAIELDSNQPAWVYSNAITLMVQIDHLNEGLELGEKALKIHPESDAIYRVIGNIQQKKNHLNAEDKNIAKQIEVLTTQAVTKHKEGNLEDAIAFYSEAIELDENQPAWVYANVITLMTQIDRLNEGLELGEKALKIHPESDEIEKALKTIQQKKNHLNAENKNIAKQIEVLTTQAVTKHKEGKIDEAITFYLGVIELDSKQPAWVYGNAITLMAQIARLDKGLELGDKALKIYPESDEIHRSVGIVFKAKEQSENSIKHYKKSIELNSYQPFWVYSALTEYLQSKGQYDEAINFNQKGLELYPEEAELHYCLGVIFKKLNKLEDSINCFQQAINLNPKHFWAHQILGDILYYQQKWNESKILFNRAIEINYQYSWTHYRLAEILTLEGEWEKAIEIFARAKNLKPEIPFIQKKIEETRSIRPGQTSFENRPYVQKSKHSPDINRLESVFNPRYFEDAPKKYKVILLNTNSETRNGYITLSIYNSLKQHEFVDLVDIAEYRNVVELSSKNDYDLFLAIDGQKLNREICRRTAASVKLSVLWTFEDPYTLNTNIANSNIFDIVCSNDMGSVKKYPGYTINLPLAGNRDYLGGFEPLEDQDFDYDIFFCGSAWPNRVETLKKLLREKPDLKYKIILHYSPQIPRHQLDLPCSSYMGAISHKTFLQMARRSRIVLNLPRKFASNDSSLASDTLPPRIFECAAAGAFQLLSENEAPVHPFYEVGKDLDTYADVNNLFEKIDYWLNNPNKRLESALSAYERTYSNHLYKNRLDCLFSECNKLVQNKIDNKIPIKIRGNKNKKPRLLFVCHNTLASPPYGGLEIHQDILAQNISNTFDIFFLCKEANPPSVISEHKKSLYRITDVEYNTLENIVADEIEMKHSLSNSTYEKIFGEILVRYRIDSIHFFHFINHLPSYAFVAKALGIPYVISIHDFYSACTEFNLIDYTGNYCDNSYENPTQCDICLSAKYNFAPGSQANRRAFFGKVLSQAFRIITVSKSTAEILKKIYPQLSENNKVIPHGAPLPSRFHALRQRVKRSKVPLKIIIFGNLALHKGSDAIIRAMNLLRNDPITFDVYGNTDSAVTERVLALSLPNVSLHGSYSPGSLDYTKYDVSLHLSIWPETHCQTLSEAWINGLVPIVTDIGALGERVQDGVTGFKIPVNSPHRLVDTIRKLTRQPFLLDKIASNYTNDLVFNHFRHRDLFKITYLEALRYSASHQTSNYMDDPLSNVNLQVSGIELRNNTWRIQPKIQSLSNEKKETKQLQNRNNCPIDINKILNTSRLEGGKMNIDFIKVDGQKISLSSAVAQISCEARIIIQGWALSGINSSTTKYKYIELRGVSNSSRHVIPTQTFNRADFADKFGTSAILDSGFTCEIDIRKSNIQPGEYNVIVLQNMGSYCIESSSNLNIEITDPLTQKVPLLNFGSKFKTEVQNNDHFKLLKNKIRLHPTSSNSFSRITINDIQIPGSLVDFSSKVYVDPKCPNTVVAKVSLKSENNDRKLSNYVEVSGGKTSILNLNLSDVEMPFSIILETFMKNGAKADYAGTWIIEPIFNVRNQS
jgi:tetratricopeptide (TPR) repeat protein/glycosyltransferase involved in cell wall biosynthesis